MSIKRRVLAAAATMTMVGGVGAVGLLPADAATPSCGASCVSGYGQEYGAPFVFDVLRQGEKAGQPVILFRASTADPAEDFTIADEGTVNTFYTTYGLVSAGLAKTYGTDTAYELAYAPYGVNSGLCVGVGSTAGDGTPVALEPCGASSKTVWVVDTANASGAYDPLINGSDTNFSHPFVLHYPGSAYPTDMPRPQLNTYTLQQYAGAPPTVYNNEEWTGIVPTIPIPLPIPTPTPIPTPSISLG
jgi:hypothetical protein